MAIDHVFRTDPQLGPPLMINDPDPWYDPFNITTPSYQPGQIHQGSDGHEYIWVQAGASLAAGAAVQINETTWVATAGGTIWTVPGGVNDAPVANGNWFHARRVLI